LLTAKVTLPALAVAGVGTTFISLRITLTVPLVAAGAEAAVVVASVEALLFEDEPQPAAVTGIATATATRAMVLGRRFDIVTPGWLVRLARVSQPLLLLRREGKSFLRM
jgi:hypothetical protein